MTFYDLLRTNSQKKPTNSQRYMIRSDDKNNFGGITKFTLPCHYKKYPCLWSLLFSFMLAKEIK